MSKPLTLFAENVQDLIILLKAAPMKICVIIWADLAAFIEYLFIAYTFARVCRGNYQPWLGFSLANKFGRFSAIMMCATFPQ